MTKDNNTDTLIDVSLEIDLTHIIEAEDAPIVETIVMIVNGKMTSVPIDPDIIYRQNLFDLDHLDPNNI